MRMRFFDGMVSQELLSKISSCTLVYGCFSCIDSVGHIFYEQFGASIVALCRTDIMKCLSVEGSLSAELIHMDRKVRRVD